MQHNMTRNLGWTLHICFKQAIRLKTSNIIKDGATVHSQISILPPILAINGSGPPKIISVSSPLTSASSYGVGEEIFVDVKFSSPVVVERSPALQMETGCSVDSCTTREVQKFTCVADEGKFAMHFRANSTVPDNERSYIFNIPADADQEIIKNMMETHIPGINQVTVTYGDSDDREYSGGRRACTSRGNDISISFDDVDYNFVGDDGDIPPLQVGNFFSLPHRTKTTHLFSPLLTYALVYPLTPLAAHVYITIVVIIVNVIAVVTLVTTSCRQ